MGLTPMMARALNANTTRAQAGNGGFTAGSGVPGTDTVGGMTPEMTNALVRQGMIQNAQGAWVQGGSPPPGSVQPAQDPSGIPQYSMNGTGSGGQFLQSLYAARPAFMAQHGELLGSLGLPLRNAIMNASPELAGVGNYYQSRMNQPLAPDLEQAHAERIRTAQAARGFGGGGYGPAAQEARYLTNLSEQTRAQIAPQAAAFGQAILGISGLNGPPDITLGALGGLMTSTNAQTQQGNQWQQEFALQLRNFEETMKANQQQSQFAQQQFDWMKGYLSSQGGSRGAAAAPFSQGGSQGGSRGRSSVFSSSSDQSWLANANLTGNISPVGTQSGTWNGSRYVPNSERYGSQATAQAKPAWATPAQQQAQANYGGNVPAGYHVSASGNLVSNQSSGLAGQNAAGGQVSGNNTYAQQWAGVAAQAQQQGGNLIAQGQEAPGMAAQGPQPSPFAGYYGGWNAADMYR